MRRKTARYFQPRFRIRLLPAKLTVAIDADTSRDCSSGLRACSETARWVHQREGCFRRMQASRRAKRKGNAKAKEGDPYIVIEPAGVEHEFLAPPVDGEDVGQGGDRARGQQLVREVEHFRQRFGVVLQAIMLLGEEPGQHNLVVVCKRTSRRCKTKEEANPRERSAGGVRCRVLPESDTLRHRRVRVPRPYTPCSP